MSAEMTEYEWQVEGMSCSSCAATVTRFLEKKGMHNVFVDFSTGSVKFQPNGNFDEKDIESGIESLGYYVSHSVEKKENSLFQWMKSTEGKFYICLVFTLPLLFHMVIAPQLLQNGFVQMLLCLPVFVIGVFHFGKSALGSLREGIPNMDVLIFIGSTAAFVYSVIGVFILHDRNYLFFETSAAIITLVLLGNLIEQRSVKRTRSAVNALIQLQPLKAKLIDFYGNEEYEVIHEIDQHQIRSGQYFLVNAGDRIPADGEVVRGGGYADEAMITGESTPVEKNMGSEVIAGTILVEGTIKLKAKATGKDTALAHIIEIVSEAQRKKPAIQKLADKITTIFVPVVLLIAVITFFGGWLVFQFTFQQALMNSIGVLVIACPCAMGLATPTAVMVGIGRAARKGILIKGAQTLETLASTRTVVFDKTGTLTTGEFRIKRLQPIEVSEGELKKILYSIEIFSSHPIARSICKELKDEFQGEGKLIPLQKIIEKKGRSIAAEDYSGNTYAAGSFEMAKTFTDDDSWNVYVLKNGRLIGSAEVRDSIRREAREAIEFLRSKKIKTVLLSGDREEICKAIATELQIDEYYSQKLPAEKLTIIQNLVSESPTAMVGDGINDAPALTAATTGISLSNATQVAIDAAQIILLQNNLSLLPEALRISKHTLTTIRQNLFWAFFYNALAIPVAAIGYLKPVIGALSMAFSDVIVIGNSLRLRIKKLS